MMFHLCIYFSRHYLTAVSGDVVLVPLAQLPGARCRVHSSSPLAPGEASVTRPGNDGGGRMVLCLDSQGIVRYDQSKNCIENGFWKGSVMINMRFHDIPFFLRMKKKRLCCERRNLNRIKRMSWNSNIMSTRKVTIITRNITITTRKMMNLHTQVPITMVMVTSVMWCPLPVQKSLKFNL